MASIRVRASEINRNGLWDRFCEVAGYDHYALERGDWEVTLEQEQAQAIGILEKMAAGTWRTTADA